MRQAGPQILVETKLLVIATSKYGLNRFYLMIHELPSRCFSKFGTMVLLSFDNGLKWYSETHHTRIKILVVQSKLSVLTLSSMA